VDRGGALLSAGSVLSNGRLKLTCLAVSGALFLIVAWPVVTAYAHGSNTGHVALLA